MRSILPLLSLWLCWACTQAPDPLPFYGIENPDGSPYQVPEFTFVNQDSQVVTETLVAGKIYVADFFFTRCPDICPKMSQQMLRLQKQFADESAVYLLSHTLDPKFDSAAVLRTYAEKIGADLDHWAFLTSPDDEYMYEMTYKYLQSADPTGAANGGIFHSGKFVLVDQSRHIRGFYEGTDPEEVDQLIQDLVRLLAENETQNPAP